MKQCEVCKAPSRSICTGCNAVAYCSREHQKRNWKQHKNNCWPLQEVYDDICGKYWVAARDIAEGSVLLKEHPAISGPHIVNIPKPAIFEKVQEDQSKLICIGCTAVLDEQVTYKCSTCGWPVCGPPCEKITIHSQNECSFFVQHNIKYPLKDIGPEITLRGIVLLRGMFLKSKDGPLFNKLVSNLSGRQGINQLPHKEQHKAMYAKLHYLFNAIYFKNLEDWSQLYEIVMGNGSRDFGTVNGKQIQELSIFPISHKFAHSCAPNAERIRCRTEKAQNVTGSNLKIHIRAISNIKKGEQITISNGRLSLYYGTEERIQIDLKLGQSVCSCARCADPTELGTYASALKCKSCAGYMLPKSFMDLKAQFCCLSCSDTKSRNRVSKLISTLHKHLAPDEVLTVTREEDMKKYDEFINRNSGVTLHANHWLLQQATVRYCFALEPQYAKDPRTVERALTLGRNLLKVFDLISSCSYLEKINLMLRTGKYGSLDLQNKKSNLSEDELTQKYLEIHGLANKVLEYWLQQISDTDVLCVSKKSRDQVSFDLTLARSLISEAEHHASTTSTINSKMKTLGLSANPEA